MGNTRRWYIYVTSLVGLQAVTWAVITLLRNVLIGSISPSADEIAYNIAIILVGLPIYIGHWRWAQRLAHENKEDRGSLPRCLYLYLILALSLGPMVNNVYRLFVDGVIGGHETEYLWNLIPFVILAGIYANHNKILNDDIQHLDGRVGDPTVRRLYGLLFTTVGLITASAAAYSLLLWVIYQLGEPVRYGSNEGIWRDVVRLVLGLIVWYVSWNWMQGLFKSSKEEQTSTARRVYLYLIVFISAFASISTVTRILDSLIRKILAPNSSSAGDIRDAIPVLIVAGVLWAFHAITIRQDDGSVGTVQAQESVRRAYLYLVAGIGFFAFVLGLGGVLNELIYSLGNQGFIGDGIREVLSFYISMIIAGMFTWMIPWRSIQTEVTEKDTPAVRRSLARRIYLYFYLFLSIMTLLGSLIFIVYTFLLLILGQRGGFNLSDLSGAISGSIIAGAVLAYHGSILRADGRKLEDEKKAVLAKLRIAIIDDGQGLLGSKLTKALVDELPGLEPVGIGITKDAKLAMDTKLKEKEILAFLAEAKLIIGPWSALADFDGIAPKIAKAVAASPAQKLLLPVRSPGYDWVGLGKLDESVLIPKTIKAVKQIIAGEEVVSSRSSGCATVFWIIIGLWILSGLIDLLY